MADLATLKVKVDAAEAVKQTKQLGDALKQTAMQGPLVSAAMGKTEAQVRRFAQAEAAAYREAERMNQALRQTSQSMQTTEQSAHRLGGQLNDVRALFATLVGSQVIRQLIQFSDTAALLSARLSLVTKSAGELKAVENALFASAQRTRTSYEEVAGLYVRVARNMDTLGKTQGELLRFTELVNMQLQIAGATTTEAATGVQQLGQALSKGKLDGDEFRTVLEAMPTVADALTKSLAGGVRAELFKLAEQGKITGRDIVDAILAMEAATRDKFLQMPQTIGQAFVQMRNDILRAIDDINRASGPDSKLGTTIRGLGVLIRYGAAIFAAPDPRDVAQGLVPAGPNVGQRFRAVTQQLRAEQSGTAQLHGGASAAAMARLFPETQTGGTGVSEKERNALKKALAEFEAEYAKWSEEAFNNRVDAMIEQARKEEEWVRTVNGRILQAWRDAEEEAARLRAEAADRELAAQVARDGKVAMKKIEEDKKQMDRDEQIARNFAENMQRAFGDVLTEFVTQGKVSVREVFNAMRQMGGSMIGQGISRGIMDLLPSAMGPFQSILAGAGLLGLGSLFGGRNRRPRETSEERMAKAQAQYASIDAIRQRRADEMREFIEGRTAGRGGVVQSVGTVLQETTASRMIGELVAIRVATTRTADAVSGSGSMAGTQVNVTVQGGMAGDAKAIGTNVAEAVDRLLGSRVQALRLTSGVAVTT